MKDLLYRILPVWLLSRLIEWKEAIQIGSRKTYYSQFGEDIVLQTLTRHIKAGYYVDIGANHPSRNSNTYALYKRGWRGIVIDPDPFAVLLLRRRRPRDICLQCGVGGTGHATFYRFSDHRFNTFSQEGAAEAVSKGLQELEQMSVSLYPLADILRMHPLPSIEVLSIDAEGFDMQILKSNDWDVFRPRFVLVETHHFDIECPQENDIYGYMHAHGYKLVTVLGYTLVFKNPSRI